MLVFAIEYQEGIDSVTDKHRLGLSMYALEEDEWELLRQVRDVLKVMVFACGCHMSLTCGYLVACTTGPEGRNLVFLSLDTQPLHGHSCYGLHRHSIYNWSTEERTAQSHHPSSTWTCKMHAQSVLLIDGLVSNCNG